MGRGSRVHMHGSVQGLLQHTYDPTHMAQHTGILVHATQHTCAPKYTYLAHDPTHATRQTWPSTHDPAHMTQHSSLLLFPYKGGGPAGGGCFCLELGGADKAEPQAVSRGAGGMETQEVMAQVNSGLPPVAPRLPHKAPSSISPSLLAHIPASDLVKGLIDIVSH